MNDNNVFSYKQLSLTTIENIDDDVIDIITRLHKKNEITIFCDDDNNAIIIDDKTKL